MVLRRCRVQCMYRFLPRLSIDCTIHFIHLVCCTSVWSDDSRIRFRVTFCLHMATCIEWYETGAWAQPPSYSDATVWSPAMAPSWRSASSWRGRWGSYSLHVSLCVHEAGLTLCCIIHIPDIWSVQISILVRSCTFYSSGRVDICLPYDSAGNVIMMMWCFSLATFGSFYWSIDLIILFNCGLCLSCVMIVIHGIWCLQLLFNYHRKTLKFKAEAMMWNA